MSVNPTSHKSMIYVRGKHSTIHCVVSIDLKHKAFKQKLAGIRLDRVIETVLQAAIPKESVSFQLLPL